MSEEKAGSGSSVKVRRAKGWVEARKEESGLGGNKRLRWLVRLSREQQPQMPPLPGSQSRSCRVSPEAGHRGSSSSTVPSQLGVAGLQVMGTLRQDSQQVPQGGGQADRSRPGPPGRAGRRGARWLQLHRLRCRTSAGTCAQPGLCRGWCSLRRWEVELRAHERPVVRAQLLTEVGAEKVPLPSTVSTGGGPLTGVYSWAPWAGTAASLRAPRLGAGLRRHPLVILKGIRCPAAGKRWRSKPGRWGVRVSARAVCVGNARAVCSGGPTLSLGSFTGIWPK